MMKFFDKAKASASILAGKTSEAALNAADIAGKKATSVVENTKINLKIFDLNTDIEIRYKEIGKIIYGVHIGEETNGDNLQQLMEEIDEKRKMISTLKEQQDEKKDKQVCPTCGKECNKEDEYCSSCGKPLTEKKEEKVEEQQE